MMGLGGGMPSPEEMAKLAEKMPGGRRRNAGLPPAMPGVPGLPGSANSRRPAGGWAASCRRRAALPPGFFKKK